MKTVDADMLEDLRSRIYSLGARRMKVDFVATPRTSVRGVANFLSGCRG